MLAFSGAEITDERWHLEALFRTSKTQEDVQRRNVYPHDLLTIMVGAGLLIGTIPAKAWSHSRDGMCPCLACWCMRCSRLYGGTGTFRTAHSHNAWLIPVTR